LTQEVTDLNLLSVVVNNNVDGKMGIYVTHLVLETLGNTGNHVVDNGTDGANASNVLAIAVVDNKLKLLLTSELDLHVKVTKVLGELAAGTLDGHNARLDGDINVVGDDELVVLVDVLRTKETMSVTLLVALDKVIQWVARVLSPDAGAGLHCGCGVK